MIIQKFDIVIEHVDHVNREFTARLLDRTDPNMPEESGTISFEFVPEKHWPVIQEGMLFYWHITDKEENDKILPYYLEPLTKEQYESTVKKANDAWKELFGFGK